MSEITILEDGKEIDKSRLITLRNTNLEGGIKTRLILESAGKTITEAGKKEMALELKKFTSGASDCLVLPRDWKVLAIITDDEE